MVEVENCWFEYRPHLPPVFERLSFQHPARVSGAETGPLVILGPQACGKSTLMRLLAGQERATRGAVRILGTDAGRRPLAVRRRAAYVPQELGLPGDLTLTEYLTELGELDNPGAPMREISARVRWSIARVHLEAAAHRRLGAFSGGMKRRSLLAQALLRDAAVILVDAPTAGLDPYEQTTVMSLLRAESRRRLIVMATAHPREAAALPGRCLLIDGGRIAADLPTQELAGAAVHHVFRVPRTARQHIRSQDAGWLVPTRHAAEMLVVAEDAPIPEASPVEGDAELGYLYLLWRARRRMA